MNLFEANVANTIKKYNMIKDNDVILIGLSGGADSSALLCALKNLYNNTSVTLVAAHLNHGIRGDEAIRDMRFSQLLARKFGICFVSKNVNVPEYSKNNKISEETAGRKLRYEFFEEICDKYGCNKIAVAHNRNDKAETFLINLIRGAGMSGLSSIPPINGKIIRPLIETDRKDIEKYATDNGIDFVTDSTNNSDEYTRNIVRNHIIPKMQCINENAVNNILRCSAVINEENIFVDDYIKELNVVFKKDNTVYIERKKFETLHKAVKSKILFKAFELFCSSTLNISSAQIESVLGSLKTGNKFSFHDGIILTVENEFILLSYSQKAEEYEYFPIVPCKIYVEQTDMSYAFEFCNNADFKEKNSIYLDYDKLKGKQLALRSKKDGDCFEPSGMNGTKKVKKFFIDNKISASKKNFYPLLTADGETAAIIPMRVGRNYIIDNKTKKILKITVLGGTNDK